MFLFGERTPEGQSRRGVKLRFGSVEICRKRPAKCSDILTTNGIVQHRERLNGRQCRGPFWGEYRWIRTVQPFHEWIGHTAHDEAIDTASIPSWPVGIKTSIVVNGE